MVPDQYLGPALKLAVLLRYACADDTDHTDSYPSIPKIL
jgi:hypothetical protein